MAIRRLIVIGVASIWLAASSAQSATVRLFPDNPIANSGVPGNSVTGVLFRAEQEVTINSISTYINADESLVAPPYSSPYSGFFRIYKSNLAGGLEGICCTLTAGFSFDPAGVGWYTKTISETTLQPGIYTLRMSLQGGGPAYHFFGQSESNLPYTTTAGLFTVLDGSSNNAGGIYNDYSTTILPSFALGVSAIPLPASIVLFVSGLAALFSYCRVGGGVSRLRPKLSI